VVGGCRGDAAEEGDEGGGGEEEHYGGVEVVTRGEG
jgi:hypothetical protein